MWPTEQVEFETPAVRNPLKEEKLLGTFSLNAG